VINTTAKKMVAESHHVKVFGPSANLLSSCLPLNPVISVPILPSNIETGENGVNRWGKNLPKKHHAEDAAVNGARFTELRTLASIWIHVARFRRIKAIVLSVPSANVR